MSAVPIIQRDTKATVTTDRDYIGAPEPLRATNRLVGYTTLLDALMQRHPRHDLRIVIHNPAARSSEVVLRVAHRSSMSDPAPQCKPLSHIVGEGTKPPRPYNRGGFTVSG